MATTQEKPGLVDQQLEQLLADAGAFFEAYLWKAEGSGNARDLLAKKGLKQKVIRAFGVGYAPMGPDILMSHLRGLGYSIEEMEAAGLARRSARGRLHAHFRSRIMFPVKDRDGLILGFAGLGTHLGPSWPLWVSSPDTDLYRRSQAVFGLDRAAKRISTSKTALLRPDCIEVLRAHQDGETNAVTVHTEEITREQVLELADGVPGGIDGLELDLPAGMLVEPKDAPAVPSKPRPAAPTAEVQPGHLNLKRLALVTATALVAMNAWTGAPLLAVWIGSQMQAGKLLSMRGVVSVLVALAIMEFLLLLALTWLSAKYDQLTGRPRTAGLTSPWHRAKRGDRVQDIRSRYGVSAPEKAVAACVVVGVLAFEVWFFLFAGSPF
jgi:DNA primase catalytic core, N-terminal domain